DSFIAGVGRTTRPRTSPGRVEPAKFTNLAFDEDDDAIPSGIICHEDRTKSSECRQSNIRCVLACPKYLLGGFLEIRLTCEEDVRHEPLRVTVNYREPGALDLYHHPVSFQKRVVVGGKTDLVVRHLVGSDGLGLFDADAVAPA